MKYVMALSLAAVLFPATTYCADEKPDASKSAPTQYTGEQPKGLKVLTEHRVIARYEGTPYVRCMGLTGNCPDRCGGSGEFATFAITDYLHYAKKGEYGGRRKDKFAVRISDFHRNPVVDGMRGGKPYGGKELHSVIAGLTVGDMVQIEWKHLYGQVSKGVTSSARPVLLLKKINDMEASRLKREGDKLATEKKSDAPSTKQSITAFLSLDTTDRIVVAYAPKADFAADDVHRFEITSAKTVQVWLKALSQIPAQGPGIRAKLPGDAPEYRIELFEGEKRLGQLRMKAGKLDSPAGTGWDFYKMEDRAFVKIVETAHQRN
jgi:hypothetical protein